MLDSFLFPQSEGPDSTDSQPDLKRLVRAVSGLMSRLTKPPLAHRAKLPDVDLNNSPVAVPAIRDLASSSFSRPSDRNQELLCSRDSRLTVRVANESMDSTVADSDRAQSVPHQRRLLQTVVHDLSPAELAGEVSHSSLPDP